MHEWALAESVIVTVMKEAEKNHLTQVTTVVVRVGELQQIDLDIFKSAIESLRGALELPIPIGTVQVEEEKSLLTCRTCGREWTFHRDRRGLQEVQSEAIHFIPEIARTYLKCPACGSPDFQLTKGRGVSIDSIEGEN
ncbi:MAG: hydrogenase nickel incorporation protein HypA [Chitinivibrionia bacterium]|nr:hydrogenase nickel incorporation protein HypA [Chitinivibrionia bacterium]